ncbi:hypothetical protein [Pontibacillus salipaludis]|uniref:hypothetical protein n=1 Tax=Pontibacillus salipaludis TaxID=1697394 RepID=UPI0031EB3B5D
MKTLKKEDVIKEINELIQSLSTEDSDHIKTDLERIKSMMEQILTEEDELYYNLINKSLGEDWNNEKDDAYNDI